MSLSPVLVLGAAGAMGLLVLAVRRPALACAVLAIGIPLTAGIARGTALPVLRVNEALLLVVVAGFTLHWLVRRRPLAFTGLDIVVLTFCLVSVLIPWAVILLTRADADQSDWLVVLGPIQYALVYLLFSRTEFDDGDRRLFFNLCMLASIPVAAVAVAQTLDLGPTRDLVNGLYPTAPLPSWDNTYRPSSLLGHYSALGAFGLLNFLLALALAATRHPGFSPYWLAAVMGVNAASVVVSQTYAPAVALVLGAAVVLLAARRVPWRQAAAAPPVLAAAGIVFWPSISGRLTSQLSVPGGSGLPDSVQTRIDFWQGFFLPALLRHGPWLGTGTLMPPEVPRPLVDFVDNGYLWQLFRAGVPGLAVLIAMLVAVAAAGWNARRSPNPSHRVVGLVCAGAVVSVVLMDTTSEYLTFTAVSQEFWMLVGLLAGFGAVAVRQARPRIVEVSEPRAPGHMHMPPLLAAVPGAGAARRLAARSRDLAAPGNLLRSSALLTAGNAAARFLSLLFSVAAARFLAPAGYGVLAYALVLANVGSILIMNAPLGLTRVLSRHRDQPRERDAWFTNWMSVIAGITVVSLVLTAPAALLAGLGGWLLLALLANLVGTAALQTYLQVECGLERFRLMVGFWATANLLQLAAALAAGLAGYRVPAVFLAIYGLSSVAALAVMLPLAPVPLRFRPETLSWDRVRTAVRYTTPLILMNAFATVWLGADVVLVERMVSPAAAGRYAAAKVVVNGFAIVSWAISNALLPRASRLDGPALRAQLLRALGLTAAAVVPLLLMLALVARPLLGLVFGSRFDDAGTPLTLLAAGMAAYAFYSVIESAWLGFGRPGMTALARGVGMAGLLLTAPGLIQAMGATGAALAFGIGSAAQLALLAALTVRAPQLRAGGGPRRTFSTGFEGSRLRTYLELLRHQRHSPEFGRKACEEFRQIAEIFAARGRRPLEGARVLDVGCGQRFALTLLFHSVGARATGIDMDRIVPGLSPGSLLGVWRRNGLERAVKTAVRHLLFDRAYYRSLAAALGRPLRWDGLDLRAMDACRLDFPDRTFDLVASTSVYEHLYDVEAATREMARVLRPGGVAYVKVCLFPGMPGGHHYEWGDPDQDVPRDVPPWDHLRGNRYPTQAYLNRLRQRDYLDAFGRHLEIVDVVPRLHTDRYLTPEIERELADYSREDLLTTSLLVVLRRPLDGAGEEPEEAEEAEPASDAAPAPARPVLVVAEELTGNLDEGYERFVRAMVDGLGSRRPTVLHDLRGHRWDGPAPVRAVRRTWRTVRAMADPELRGVRPAVVLYASRSAVTVPALLRARLLRLACGGAPVALAGLQTAARPRAGRLALRVLGPDLLLAPTDRDRDAARAAGVLAESVSGGVDLERFRPARRGERARLRRRWKLPAEDRIVLHVGHLRAGRNLLALAPLAGAAGVTMVVVASRHRGPESERLRRDLEERGVVVLDGFLPEVGELYRLADCYAFPTVSPDDAIALPLSVLEALASDLPVVATRFGALAERLAGVPGLTLADDPAEIPRLAQAASRSPARSRRHVEPYAWDALVARAAEALEEVELGAGASGSARDVLAARVVRLARDYRHLPRRILWRGRPGYVRQRTSTAAITPVEEPEPAPGEAAVPGTTAVGVVTADGTPAVAAAAGLLGLQVERSRAEHVERLIDRALVGGWELVAAPAASLPALAGTAGVLGAYVGRGGTVLVDGLDERSNPALDRLAADLGRSLPPVRPGLAGAELLVPGCQAAFGGALAGTMLAARCGEHVLEPCEPDDVLAWGTAGGVRRPVVVQRRLGRGRIVLSTLPPPAEAAPADVLASGESGSLVVALLLLRQLFGVAAWHAPRPVANFTIDDPALRRGSLGLRYDLLAAQARDHGFHVTVATVPRELALAGAGVVELLRRRPEVLSACYHGCDHDGYEFYRTAGARTAHQPRPLAAQRAALWRAVEHGRRFASTGGCRLDRVMVFPYGVGPASLLPDLRRLGFVATCNYWDKYPLEAPVPDRPDLGLRPADLAWEGFPLLWRRHLRDRGFLLDLLLGRPVLAFAHRRALGRDFAPFVERARAINRAGRGGVAWCGLDEVARHAHLQRRTGDGRWEVLMTGDEACLHNPDPSPRTCTVTRPDLPADGRLEAEGAHGRDGLELTIPAGATRSVRVVRNEAVRVLGPPPTRCSIFTEDHR